MAEPEKNPDPPQESPIVEAEPGGLDLSAPPDEESAEPSYTPPNPSTKDKKIAGAVLTNLKKADILGPERSIEGLLQVVDIVPSMTVPDEWPGDDGQEYHESEMLEIMAGILIKGCSKLTINVGDVVFLWRNKEKWVQGGRTVRGNVKSFPHRVRHLLEGRKACVEINFHHFKTINPLQKVFTVYHELRQLGEDGGIRKPDFTGFYDEFELFGARTFRENMELARVMEIGAQVQYEHQLPLWEEE